MNHDKEPHLSLSNAPFRIISISFVKSHIKYFYLMSECRATGDIEIRVDQLVWYISLINHLVTGRDCLGWLRVVILMIMTDY